ncbi:MAG: hypothetical protein R3B13_15060 [Polyangiaceae bacterium]
MLRQDYIGRLIQQLAEALARIAGLSRRDQRDEIEQELQSAEAALGLFKGMDRLDARSAAMILGGGDKVVLAAQLIEQRAMLAAEAGDAAREAVLRRRARELLACATPHELVREAAELGTRLGR